MSLALQFEQQERFAVPIDRALALSRSIFVDVIERRRRQGMAVRPVARAFELDGWWFAIVEFEEAGRADLVIKLERDPCRP